MTHKKIAVILCTSIISASLMAGCGGNEQAAENTTESAVETSVETEVQETQSADDEASDEAGEETAQGSSTNDGEVISDTTVSGWHIVVENAQINKSLENVSVDLGYTGVETSDFVKEAGEGNTFCLLKLLIEKDGSKEVIDWASMKLTDSEGNEYTRMEDEFITDLGMVRMSGTALNFGSNEGWIAFEIKEGASGLQLSYPFEEEAYSCDLSSVQ